MALFQKKSKAERMRRALDALRTRAGQLAEKRQTAEAMLADCMSARQSHLIEGDLGDEARTAKLQNAVDRAQSNLQGILDAVAALEVQIAAAEAEARSEAERAERAAVAAKLAKDIECIANLLPDWLQASRDLADAMDAIHWRFENAQVAHFVRQNAAEVEAAMAINLPDLHAAVTAIRDGHMPMPPPASVVTEVLAEPSPEPTQVVFCLRPVKWRTSDGRLQLADQYQDAELPLRLVERALRLGACVALSDPRRRELKGPHGGRHPSADGAFDLDEDEAVLPRQIDPVDHSVLHAAEFRTLDRSGEDRTLQISVVKP